MGFLRLHDALVDLVACIPVRTVQDMDVPVLRIPAFACIAICCGCFSLPAAMAMETL